MLISSGNYRAPVAMGRAKEGDKQREKEERKDSGEMKKKGGCRILTPHLGVTNGCSVSSKLDEMICYI